jgi:hypothetical protein
VPKNRSSVNENLRTAPAIICFALHSEAVSVDTGAALPGGTGHVQPISGQEL